MPQPLRIGVSASFMHPDPERALYKGKTLLYAEQSLFHWLLERGALCYLIPNELPGGTSLADLIGSLDALILSGGADMAPGSYGEKPMRPEWSGDALRDAYDLALVRTALDLNKPVLGICRGMQVLNVAFGGTLFQDISTQRPQALGHRNWEIYDDNFHDVRIAGGTRLAALYGGPVQSVINSIHHQGVKDLARPMEIEAYSPADDVAEAIRLKDRDAWVHGVQWHPEFYDDRAGHLLARGPLLDDFLNAAAARRR